MNAPKTITDNPNASVAGGTTGVGALAVYLLGLAGVDVPAEVAVAAIGAITTAVLFVGQVGLNGVVSRVWKGRDNA